MPGSLADSPRAGVRWIDSDRAILEVHGAYDGEGTAIEALFCAGGKWAQVRGNQFVLPLCPSAAAEAAIASSSSCL